MLRVFVVLALAVAFSTVAGAQIVPSIDMATREYGLSGSYVKTPEQPTGHESDLDILGTFGYHFGILGLEAEAETGYSRFNASGKDSTETILHYAGNGILNVPLFWNISGYGLVGYGHMKITTDPKGDDNTEKIGRNFLQYGFGGKWMFVPNAAIRAEWRRISVEGAESGDPKIKNDAILFGFAIFQ